MASKPLLPLSNTARRNRVLLAMEDCEWLVSAIAAWAELSDQQTRADLEWLARNGFVETGETDDGRWWQITDKGREYVDGLSEEDKTW